MNPLAELIGAINATDLAPHPFKLDAERDAQGYRLFLHDPKLRDAAGSWHFITPRLKRADALLFLQGWREGWRRAARRGTAAAAELAALRECEQMAIGHVENCDFAICVDCTHAREALAALATARAV